MLDINHLSKRWGAGTLDERMAVRDVSLHLDTGDFLVVVGGNGSGKSTLLNLIAGVHRADGGSIFLDDVNLTALPEYKRASYIGRVFQDPLLGSADGMTVEENLALAVRRGKKRGLRWGVTAKERTEFREMLAQLELGLENRLQSKVGLLSGGQRQALTLLMAAAMRPKLLLLDEHTAALDPKTAARILALTKSLIERHQLTAIMVTHSMKDAAALGTRLIMMREGEVLYSAAGEDKRRLTAMDLLDRFHEEEAVGA